MLLFLLTASLTYAQTSPENYLAQLPVSPKSCGNSKSAEKESYVKLVRGLKDRMDKDILQRKEQSQVYVDAYRNTTVLSSLQRLGSVERSPGKGGKPLKEEKTAQTPAGIPVQDKTKQAKLIHDLQIEQKALAEKIDARRTGVLNKFKTLDQNAAAMKAKELDPLQRQLASLGGLITSKEQSDQLNQLAIKLKDAQKRYCETYSSQYRFLLDEYLTAVKASLPDYRRLEEIVTKTQMGLDKPIDAHAGQLGIEALRDYTAMLVKVFKYDLPFEY